MKTKLKTTIVLLSILSTLPAFAQGTHARFDTETGTSEGKGTLHRVPFTWKASQPIEKTLDSGTGIRTFKGVAEARNEPSDCTHG